MARHWREPQRDTPQSDLRALAWTACLGGLLGVAICARAHDPWGVLASACVALVGGLAVGAMGE